MTPYIYTILYYTILYYTILYYTILYYTILYYTILYYTTIITRVLVFKVINNMLDQGYSLGNGDPWLKSMGRYLIMVVSVLWAAILQMACTEYISIPDEQFTVLANGIKYRGVLGSSSKQHGSSSKEHDFEADREHIMSIKNFYANVTLRYV